jgi:hypothetical protein
VKARRKCKGTNRASERGGGWGGWGERERLGERDSGRERDKQADEE